MEGMGKSVEEGERGFSSKGDSPKQSLTRKTVAKYGLDDRKGRKILWATHPSPHRSQRKSRFEPQWFGRAMPGKRRERDHNLSKSFLLLRRSPWRDTSVEQAFLKPEQGGGQKTSQDPTRNRESLRR